MPVNNMNVGVDYSVLYFDGNSGTIIDLGDVQNVHFTAQKHDIKSAPYNDVPRFGYIPDGFRVEFTMTRTGAVLEDFMVLFSQQFQAGQVMGPGYLNESITNTDGSISRYQFTKFIIWMSDLGDVSRDKVVTQRLEGMASDRVKIA